MLYEVITIVGIGSWAIFHLFGIAIPFVYCLLFGALISPTDPIAVGAILRKAGVPRSLGIKITGESLFNDGFGVVIFVLVLGVATAGEAASFSHVVRLFVTEAGGGILYGLVVGVITSYSIHYTKLYEPARTL